MNRFEIAENLIATMDMEIEYQSPYAVALRTAIAAVLSDDEPEPVAFEVGVEWAGIPPETENGWAIVRHNGESWLLLTEIDEGEARGWPDLRLIRRGAGGGLRFVVSMKPTVRFSSPGAMGVPRISYQWGSIRKFEDDERGIRDVFKSWLEPDGERRG